MRGESICLFLFMHWLFNQVGEITGLQQAKKTAEENVGITGTGSV